MFCFNFMLMLGLPLLMPKKVLGKQPVDKQPKEQPKEKKLKVGAAEGAPEVAAKRSDNLAKANFNTQMKKSENDNHMACYKHYKTLGRFDAEKTAIVEKWSADKSCKWFNEYSMSHNRCEETESRVVNGWGSRLLGFTISLCWVVFLLVNAWCYVLVRIVSVKCY
jgi:hypothetical protein